MSSKEAAEASKSWHHSLSGGVAGSVSVFFLHPFDVVKTRLQVQDGHQKQLVYRGTWDAVQSMARKEGWRAFYNGLVPAWIGSGVAWSTYLTVYESIKSYNLYRQDVDRLSTHWHTISAAEAGALVCVLTNPVWLIKTRMQLQQRLPGAAATAAGGPGMQAVTQGAAAAAAAATSSQIGNATGSISSSSNSSRSSSSGSAPDGGIQRNGSRVGSSISGNSSGGGSSSSRLRGSALPGFHSRDAERQYRGFFDALWKIWREEGLRGYYKGLGPSLVLQTTHGAAQFTVYEELKHMAARAGQSPTDPDRAISSFQTTVFAATSKFAASVLTYPSQVVRSRLQQRDFGRDLTYKNSWQVMKLTWKHEGVRGFYKGLGPALLRVMPQSAITLVVYEKLLTLLKAQKQ
ncbi:mitochondrial carrier domain-containing protein [Dunaliella salina]|uniref:Mitochondrial carrier domain-containing protein n=1 Tax=Dunaliella salina TaxID=3046 RepID=A0ABQ7H9Y6_DUNSA|nr:mitochondrial carrier domain-containing protein [Dunaliella salina]|eukprot:KAF5843664.1 mitochondrial carrier domain-containing protein [Dunaliella salina]